MTDSLRPHWFQILLALSEGPLHGTAIMDAVLEQTEGSMTLWPATLYGSLRDLAETGWIREAAAPPGAPHEGGTRRFHTLTPAGRRALQGELERLQGILKLARRRRLIPGEGGG